MWPLEEVLQEAVRPLRGEGGVKAEEGVSRAGEGDSDLQRKRSTISPTQSDSCHHRTSLWGRESRRRGYQHSELSR